MRTQDGSLCRSYLRHHGPLWESRKGSLFYQRVYARCFIGLFLLAARFRDLFCCGERCFLSRFTLFLPLVLLDLFAEFLAVRCDSLKVRVLFAVVGAMMTTEFPGRRLNIFVLLQSFENKSVQLETLFSTGGRLIPDANVVFPRAYKRMFLISPGITFILIVSVGATVFF